MTNDESKMTKEIRMTNGAPAGFGAVDQTKIGNGRRADRFLGHLEFDIPLSLVIGHWSFCWLKV
jgi:hypothetical protein